MGRRFQFSLRQLCLATTLMAVAALFAKVAGDTITTASLLPIVLATACGICLGAGIGVLATLKGRELAFCAFMGAATATLPVLIWCAGPLHTGGLSGLSGPIDLALLSTFSILSLLAGAFMAGRMIRKSRRAASPTKPATAARE